MEGRARQSLAPAEGQVLFTRPVLGRHRDFGEEFKSFPSSQVSVPLPATSSLEKYGSTEQQLDKLWKVTSDLSERFRWEVTASGSVFRLCMCPYLSTAPVLPCRA